MAAQQPIVAISMLMVAACASAQPLAVPPRQDVEFLRGCWVAKAPPAATIQGFLRLLPPSPGADTLEGEVTPADADAPRLSRGFRFSRDGQSAGSTMTTSMLPSPTQDMKASPVRNPKPLIPGWRRVSWAPAQDRNPTRWLVAEGDEEHLKVYMHYDPAVAVKAAQGNFSLDHATLFDGERDGCD